MPALRAASRTCTMCGTHWLPSATSFMRSHTLPPSEMKSLYGSTTMSPVMSFSYVRCAMSFLQSKSVCANVRIALSKRKREGLDTGVEEFDLKVHVLDLSLLPDELIHSGLSNLTCAIGGGIGTMVVAGCG